MLIKMEKRSKNFTANEKDSLVDLVFEHKNIIENKKTDATTTQEKNTAWEIVTQQFNARNESGIRTAKQLKELYGLLKRKARKNLHNDRAERIKTSGGAYSPQSSEMDHNLFLMKIHLIVVQHYITMRL
ncbi:hypothetical protein ILUMI_00870 [Ignelater luminosus]|uniref:Regulatory protein zeste n=1 Tax=Ignelater luminosus TaxID=2038154 RepID=A0A8K0DL34_IGNLU|nr:hypothetical protein ILUMI_00870 [Ignelater luminosus]